MAVRSTRLLWIERGLAVASGLLFVVTLISKEWIEIVFGVDPGHLREELAVPFDRPRPLSLKRDPAFLRITDGIWTIIMEEAKRSGLYRAT